MAYSDIDQISAGSHLDDNGNESNRDEQYEVINTAVTGGCESRGLYETLDEARGCVAYDHLTSYEIWHGNTRVSVA